MSVTVTVTNSSQGDAAVVGAWVGFYDSTFSTLLGSGTTDASGEVVLAVTATTEGFIFCRGTTAWATDTADELEYERFTTMPRLYAHDKTDAVALNSEDCVSFVLKGYDSSGELMRMADWAALGGSFCPILPYDANGTLVEHSYFSVNDRISEAAGGADDDRIPCLAFPTGSAVVALKVFSWKVYDATGARGTLVLPAGSYVNDAHRFIHLNAAIVDAMFELIGDRISFYTAAQQEEYEELHSIFTAVGLGPGLLADPDILVDGYWNYDSDELEWSESRLTNKGGGANCTFYSDEVDPDMLSIVTALMASGDYDGKTQVFRIGANFSAGKIQLQIVEIGTGTVLATYELEPKGHYYIYEIEDVHQHPSTDVPSVTDDFVGYIDYFNVHLPEYWGTDELVTNESEYSRHCDKKLFELLEFYERVEFSLVAANTEAYRKGTTTITIEDEDGNTIDDQTIRMTVAQSRFNRDFMFGIFPGTDGNTTTQALVDLADEIGFDYVTFFLPQFWTAWAGNGKPSPVVETGWDLDPRNYVDEIDDLWGISLFKDAGYRTKGHAINFQQETNWPDAVWGLGTDDFDLATRLYCNRIIEALSDLIDDWECINEGSYSNDHPLVVSSLVASALVIAGYIQADSKECVINSAEGPIPTTWQSVEVATHKPANYPTLDTSYEELLEYIDDNATLGDIDVIGLQFYPGAYVSWEMWGVDAAYNGSGRLPCDVVTEINRHSVAGDGKQVHITEFSVPAISSGDWHNGFWVCDWGHSAKQQWTEETQADYVERVYRYAFSCQKCSSITWWDLDKNRGFPAITNGALYDRHGNLKEVGERIQSLIEEWTTTASYAVSNGVQAVEGYGGSYSVTLKLSDGRTVTDSFSIAEQDDAGTKTVTVPNFV